MESSTINPSIRKQFLTKIYQRTASSAYEHPIPEEHNSSQNANVSFTSLTSDSIPDGSNTSSSPSRAEKRSSTPGLHAKRRASSASSVASMDVFSDFLTDLLRANGKITAYLLAKVNDVAKALNDNFAKNPEFSLQFYISMTGILNLLNEPDEIDAEDLKSKVEEALALNNEGIAEMEQLTCLKKHILKINLKVITV
jgi:hypothetical protein